MTPDELRALADAIVYRDSLAIARAADYLRACAEAKPVAVPAGWQLVPVEPTPEMLDEGCDVDARAEVIKKYAAMPVIRNPENCCSCGEMLAVQYRAMLAAAPAAPQAEPPQVFTRWVRDNMPPNTVISDPDWWAARLWRAAMRAHGIGGSDAE